MTRRVSELRAIGIHETLCRFRSWRRTMHLSIVEAAAMAGVHPAYLKHLEEGVHRPKNSHVYPKLQALMARWEGSRP